MGLSNDEYVRSLLKEMDVINQVVKDKRTTWYRPALIRASEE